MKIKDVLQSDLKYKGMAIFLLFTISIVFLVYSQYIKIAGEMEAINEVYSYDPAQTPPDEYKMIFVGDIMLDRGVEMKVKEYGSGNYKFPFENIAGYLKGADLAIGNLEGPVSDKGYNVGSIYSFRDDPAAIGGLEYAGIDLVCLANNHMFDYTRDALEDTFSRLEGAGIKYTGAGTSRSAALEPKVLSVGQTKIAFLAFTKLGSESWQAQENSSGLAWLTDDNVKTSVAKARSKADVVVVMFHFGDEYKPLSNSDQKHYAHLAIDSGADLVVGHHPHVSQETEKYKGKYIAYSLGNFVFDQDFSEETMKSLALEVSVSNKKIKTVSTRQIKINKFYQPELAD
ncbi:MAG: CapA family protein [Candidatus Paceibacterota bacterium]|jgi:poly-gamma-glutamate synthesis protein (capsule biosynthesis protein)